MTKDLYLQAVTLAEKNHFQEMDTARGQFFQSTRLLDTGFNEMNLISDQVNNKLDAILAEMKNIPLKTGYNNLRDVIHRTTDAVVYAVNNPNTANLATVRAACLGSMTSPGVSFRSLLRYREELQKCATQPNDARMYLIWASTFIGALMETMAIKTLCDGITTEGRLSALPFKREIEVMKSKVAVVIEQLDIPFLQMINRYLQYSISDRV